MFFPFKAAYNLACETWLLNHPGVPLTIYEVAAIVNTALDKSFTPRNIKSGFSSTGIYPFNNDIFTDADFIESAVTDRPMVIDQNSQPLAPTDADELEQPAAVDSPSAENAATCSSSNGQSHFAVSPQDIRPYPLAGPRKNQSSNVRKKKSAVITNSPEKDQLVKKMEEKHH